MKTTKYGLLALLLTGVTALACSTKNDGGNDGPDAGDDPDVIIIPSGGNGGDGNGTATGNGGGEPEGGSGSIEADASIGPGPGDNGGAGGAPNGGADPGGAPNGGTNPGGSTNGGSDPGGSTNGGSDPGGSTNGGNGGVGGNGGSGGFEAPDREDCDEPTEDDCYDLTTCNGVEEIQFLEQCNDGTCFPFDNEDRIANYTGALPPL